MKLGKLWIGLLGVVASVGILTNTTYPVLAADAFEQKESTSEFEEIRNDEVLSQKEADYYVYYYMEGCPDCEKAKPTLNELGRYEKIYAVNFSENADSISFYDWTQHHINYDIEIGSVENGIEKFYMGESREKYENGIFHSPEGKRLDYDVVIADAEYLNENPLAKLGYIYAKLQTPLLNYSNVEEIKDILIAGFPTVLHIKNGRIDTFYYDAPDIIDNLGRK